MKKLLLSLLFFVSVSANAQSTEWSNTDKLLLGAAMTAHIIDWGQTRYISTHSNKYAEQNPLLGRHPSTSEVNRHFALGMIAMPLMAHLFPKYRSGILGSWLVVEVISISNNYHIGIKVSF